MKHGLKHIQLKMLRFPIHVVASHHDASWNSGFQSMYVYPGCVNFACSLFWFTTRERENKFSKITRSLIILTFTLDSLLYLMEKHFSHQAGTTRQRLAYISRSPAGIGMLLQESIEPAFTRCKRYIIWKLPSFFPYLLQLNWPVKHTKTWPRVDIGKRGK